MRLGWLSAAQGLTDAQYREFVNKIAVYGFSECTEDVRSDDLIINSMLEMVKPSVKASVSKYVMKCDN